MGEMRRAIAREEQERRTQDRFASTLVIAASIIAAVRLARDDISRPTPAAFRYRRKRATGKDDSGQSGAVISPKSDFKSQRTPDEQCELLPRVPVAAWDITTGSLASHLQSRRESRT